MAERWDIIGAMAPFPASAFTFAKVIVAGRGFVHAPQNSA